MLRSFIEFLGCHLFCVMRNITLHKKIAIMEMELIKSPEGVSKLMKELRARHEASLPQGKSRVHEVVLPPPTDEELARAREKCDSIVNPRDTLKKIEQLIIDIVGEDIEALPRWTKNDELREKVEDLLEQRAKVLNEMFVANGRNIDWFNRINDYLLELTNKLYARVKDIVSKQKLLADADFDDDVMVEGRLRFIFDGPESIKTLGDEDYYESNFPVMINTLYHLYEEKGIANIELTSNGEDNLNDGDSWDEYPFRGKPGFEDIVICHAVHVLTDHMAYSIPDIIRLNDLWNEVGVTYQSLTDLDGKRWEFKE